MLLLMMVLVVCLPSHTRVCRDPPVVVVAYLTDVANAGLVVLVGLAAADAVAVAVVARFAFSAYTRR